MFYNQSTVVDKGLGERDVRFASLDAVAGSVVTNLIAFFIILTTAATLWAHGQPADTVVQVSESLRPLAGRFTSELFAIGLLNAAVMAMAVLPLSTAYAICESFGWERSVSRGVRQAPLFFGLFAGLLLIGALAVLVPGVPLVFLLILPNVVGAILLPIIIVLALRLVNDRRLMGRWVNSRSKNIVAWATTGVLVLLSAVYLGVAVLQAMGIINA